MASTHSLDLESTSSQYAIKESPTGLPTTGDVTMEAWFNPESLAAVAVLISTGGGDPDATEANNQRYSLQVDTDGKIRYFHEYSTGANELVTTTSAHVSTGNWYHLAQTRKVSTKEIIFYLNGVAIETLNYTNAPTGGTTIDLIIGADDVLSIFVDGLVKEIRIWDHVRTPSEIYANYQRELAGNESGLAGYFKFNNDYMDETANGNDLTAVNSPAFSTDIPVFVSPSGSLLVNSII